MWWKCENIATLIMHRSTTGRICVHNSRRQTADRLHDRAAFHHLVPTLWILPAVGFLTKIRIGGTVIGIRLALLNARYQRTGGTLMMFARQSLSDWQAVGSRLLVRQIETPVR